MKANFLVQILLPTRHSNGKAIPRHLFQETTRELTGRFGGLTAYTRSPAKGLWTDNEEKSVEDEIVIYEVMVGDVDAPWWGDYRRALEDRFGQECVVIRCQKMELL